jgi:lysylphosphatidylglycerol synthetase-like protein (DUF2156 family)
VDEEPYAVTLPVLHAVPKPVRSSAVPLAAGLFASPALWALPLLVWALPRTTWPRNQDGAQIIAQLVAFAAFALLALILPLVRGLLARSQISWVLSLAVCGVQVTQSLIVLAIGAGVSPLLVVVFGHTLVASSAAAWLLALPRTREEFWKRTAQNESERWQAVLAPSEEPGAGAPRDLLTLAKGLSTAQRVLLGAAVMLAVAAGNSTHVTGNLVRQSIPTMASYGFMLASLGCAAAAALLGRRRP